MIKICPATIYVSQDGAISWLYIYFESISKEFLVWRNYEVTKYVGKRLIDFIMHQKTTTDNKEIGNIPKL